MKRRPSPVTAQYISIILIFVYIPMLVLGLFGELPLLTVSALILMGASIVVDLLFRRCLHCGRYLGRFGVAFCPHCGEGIDF